MWCHLQNLAKTVVVAVELVQYLTDSFKRNVFYAHVLMMMGLEKLISGFQFNYILFHYAVFSSCVMFLHLI